MKGLFGGDYVLNARIQDLPASYVVLVSQAIQKFVPYVRHKFVFATFDVER